MKRERSKRVEQVLSQVCRKSQMGINYHSIQDYQSDVFDEIMAFTVTPRLEEDCPEEVEKLRQEGFLVIHPAAFTEEAKEHMQTNSQGTNHYTRESAANCSRSLVVDPQQERKSRLLAEEIIQFYYVNGRILLEEYNSKIKARERMLPRKQRKSGESAICKNAYAPEATTELAGLLKNVGFSTELIEEQQTLVVKGKDFSLQIDAKTGQTLVEPSKFKDAYAQQKPWLGRVWDDLKAMFSNKFMNRDNAGR